MLPLKYPPNLQIEVTERCNYNCIHCYNYWRTSDEIITDPDTDFVALAEEVIKYKPVHVVLTGGEPMLVFEKIKPAIRVLRNHSTFVSMNTNAALTTDAIAKFMKENGMTAFVSLPCCDSFINDQVTNTKNSVSKTCAGIKKLRDYGVHVTVNMVVSKINISYIFNTAKYVRDYQNVDSFYVSPVSKPIYSANSFDSIMLEKSEILDMENQLLRVAKELHMQVGISTALPFCSFMTKEASDAFAYQKHCTAGTFSYALDSAGNVKACPRDNMIYGNMFKDSLPEIWSRMEEWRDGSLVPSNCKVCEALKSCGGGCRLESFPKTGKRDQLDERANLDFVPLRFPRPKHKYIFEDNQEFEIIEGLIFTEEAVGVRISNRSDYLYVTDRLSEFLKSRTRFRIQELGQFFTKSSLEASQAVILLMINKHIIFPILSRED